MSEATGCDHDSRYELSSCEDGSWGCILCIDQKHDALRAEVARLTQERDEALQHVKNRETELQAVYRNTDARINQLVSERDEALAELHQWRIRRDHGVCEEERLAELARAVQAEDKVARLRALLRTVEWAGGGDYPESCPVCEMQRHPTGQHAPDCALAAALKEA